MTRKDVGAGLYTVFFAANAYGALSASERWVIITCAILAFIGLVGVFAQFMNIEGKTGNNA